MKINCDNLPDQATRWMAGEAVPSLHDFELYDRNALGAGYYRVPDAIVNRAHRESFVRKFSFSVPCAEFIEVARELTRFVEVGCGTGFLSAVLEANGCEVWCTDHEEGDFNEHEQEVGRFRLDEIADAADIVDRYPDDCVLMSWPPYWNDYPERTLNAMEAGADLLLLMEEWRPDSENGASCGSPAFHKKLEAEFDLIRMGSLPSFWEFRDHWFHFRKKL